MAIANSGTIQGRGYNGLIVANNGAVVQLVNEGLINATSSAPYHPTAISAEGAQILNNNAIYGDVSIGSGGLSNYGFIHGLVTAHAVENYGTMSLLDASSPARVLTGTDAGDGLNNEGSITGIIAMGKGDDVVIQDRGTVTGDVDLGDGNDGYRASVGLVSGNIIGGLGEDSIAGGAAADRIYGDNLSADASGGNDVLFGFGGSDIIHGGGGADIIAGNTEDDLLYGDQGDDALYGGQGNDAIHGGDGRDLIYGGLGDDFLYGDAATDIFVFNANFGNDTVADISSAADDYDVLRFAGTFASFADVQAHMAQQGTNVVITFDSADTITILGTSVAALTADHFLFG